MLILIRVISVLLESVQLKRSFKISEVRNRIGIKFSVIHLNECESSEECLMNKSHTGIL